MEIIAATLYFLFFAVCLLGYLSFTIITHDLLSIISAPPPRTENKYKLQPLTNLFETEAELLAVLQICRLFFAIPVMLIAYESASRLHTAVGILVVILMFPLLYLFPLWLGKPAPGRVLRISAQMFSYILYPGLWLLDRFYEPVGVPPMEEEKKKTNGEQEEVESQEFKGDIIKAVSTIEETTVREVMTPRVDMLTIPASATLQELLDFFREHKFSRVPVYKESLDSIVGVAGVMDFIAKFPNGSGDVTADQIMRPPLFVPETKKVFTLLREFRESHSQMAIVIDEYGGTSGLVTLEDLLEEIVGDIADEFDEAPEEAYRERDGAFVVSGKFPIESFEEVFGIQVPDEDFETVSGLIFSVVGRIPMAGEIVKYQNLELEILEADKKRIHRVRIRHAPLDAVEVTSRG